MDSLKASSSLIAVVSSTTPSTSQQIQGSTSIASLIPPFLTYTGLLNDLGRVHILIFPVPFQITAPPSSNGQFKCLFFSYSSCFLADVQFFDHSVHYIKIFPFFPLHI